MTDREAYSLYVKLFEVGHGWEALMGAWGYGFFDNDTVLDWAPSFLWNRGRETCVACSEK